LSAVAELGTLAEFRAITEFRAVTRLLTIALLTIAVFRPVGITTFAGLGSIPSSGALLTTIVAAPFLTLILIAAAMVAASRTGPVTVRPVLPLTRSGTTLFPPARTIATLARIVRCVAPAEIASAVPIEIAATGILRARIAPVSTVAGASRPILIGPFPRGPVSIRPVLIQTVALRLVAIWPVPVAVPVARTVAAFTTTALTTVSAIVAVAEWPPIVLRRAWTIGALIATVAATRFALAATARVTTPGIATPGIATARLTTTEITTPAHIATAGVAASCVIAASATAVVPAASVLRLTPLATVA
jgi:hypothetical protein